MGCLYQISFGSKSYIGITTTTASKRWTRHCRDAKKGADYALSRAILKYGKSCAVVRTLVVVDDRIYLRDLEKRAIAAFKTKVPDGYNMTDGGDGTSGFTYPNNTFSESHKDKLRLAWKSRENKYPNLGVTMSDESRKKMSEARRGKPTGRHVTHTAETKAKISAAGKGRKHTSEALDKISFASLNRSDLARKHMSDSAKKAWVERKRGT